MKHFTHSTSRSGTILALIAIVAAVFLLARSPISRAGPIESIEELASYFRGHLKKVDVYAAKSPPLDSPFALPLQDINIDIAPQVNFGISSVLQLTVAPEIDFVLVPDPPESGAASD